MEELFTFEAEPFEADSETEDMQDEGVEVPETAFHPLLGPGRRIPRTTELEGEDEGVEVPETAFHPLLGPGRRIPRTTELETELEIIGKDERKRVHNTKGVPFRWICALKLYFPDPDDSSSDLVFIGSGTLISPRHVLTAGHCLYSEIIGSKGTTAVAQIARVIVTPGRNGSQSPFGATRSTAVHYSAQWRASRDPRFDYGLITLNAEIGAKKMSALSGNVLGYWGSPSHGSGTRIHPKEPSFLQGKPVNISGYPADKPSGTQWRSYDQVTNAKPAAGSQLIYYNLDTCGGHSGSPVWLHWKQYRNLVAIHTGPCIPGKDCTEVAGTPCFPGGQRFSSNRGVLITDSVLKDIEQWKKK